MTIDDLRRKRKDVFAALETQRERIALSSDPPAALTEALAEKLREYSAVQTEIEEAERTARPGIVPARAADAPGERVKLLRREWLRDKEGHVLPLLAPSESFGAGLRVVEQQRRRIGEAVQDLTHPERPDGPVHPGVTCGAFLRAAVTGPQTPHERHALIEGEGPAGGFTVPSALLGEFIDALRARTVVVRAGARTVPLTTAETSVAVVTADPVATWAAEGAEALSDPTFGRVTFSTRTLRTTVRTSRELLTDSVNADRAIFEALAGAMAVELDRAALFGGGGTSPSGIRDEATLSEVSMGTNGAAPTSWDEVLDLIQTVLDANGDEVDALLWSPRTRIQYAKLKDSQNNPLTMPEDVATLAKFSTTSIPVDEVQGSASTASTLFVGGFRHLWIGVRSAFRIEVSRHRLSTYEADILGVLRADVIAAHPPALGRLVGIVP